MDDIKNIESYRNVSKAPSDSGTAEKWPARTPTRLQNRMPISIFPLQRWSKDSYSSTALFELADRSIDAMLGRYSFGLSPAALLDLYMDWSMGLAFAPGKRAQLVDKWARKNAKFMGYAARYASNQNECPCIDPLPQDHRFRGSAWQKPPHNFIYQAFLLNQQWWHNATTGIKGTTPAQEHAINFAARQILDIFAPSNFIFTNPEILQKTLETGGANLVQGWNNFVEDWNRTVSGQKPAGSEAFIVGENVAVTPGKVVFENDLMELIQYEPMTDDVYAEPILITPAWIMKYYILDLSPHNSMVKYLVEQGHTVFMISWKNPGAEDREKGMDDYLHLGPLAALDAITTIIPDQKVHGVGYCLGGTLLAIAASALDRDHASPFKSLSFLASQIDFEEAGELMMFINEKQLSFLENIMWEQGFLDTKQMAGAFQLLRSNDLVWSRLQTEYLMGERRPMNDLMAWNADATRMPFRMHSEYLRQLYLNNDLTEGRYHVDGKPISIDAIRKPIFAVGTKKDHVAPWRSVYKFNLFADTDVTFLLTSGGHNAGIISEPGHPRREYQTATKTAADPYIDADTWENQTSVNDGSWWPKWQKWLATRSSERLAPPPLGAANNGYAILRNAPGLYVLGD